MKIMWYEDIMVICILYRWHAMALVVGCKYCVYTFSGLTFHDRDE